MFSIQATWRLHKKAGKKFFEGHPWVFSNEILGSPSGIEPGAWVKLQDAQGHFLAYGFGNPHSLIAFRAVSRTEQEPPSAALLEERLKRALALRATVFPSDVSYRACAAEVDGLPGLMIDRYSLSEGQGSVWVLQPHSAGIDRVLPVILSALPPGAGVIIRRDLRGRILEGLPEQASEVLSWAPIFSPQEACITLQAAADLSSRVCFKVDLKVGQKTGFFLDQVGHVTSSLQKLGPLFFHRWKKEACGRPLRLLDLCCYVGQWSVQWAFFLKKAGIPFQLTCFDASEQALQRAQANLEQLQVGSSIEMRQGEVLKDLGVFSKGSFDLVVLDPPALIQNRQALVNGSRAYLKIMTQALELAGSESAIIACSCSGLLSEDAFVALLRQACKRSGRAVTWVGRGGPSWDHPVQIEFPEGRYLKVWMGYLRENPY